MQKIFEARVIRAADYVTLNGKGEEVIDEASHDVAPNGSGKFTSLAAAVGWFKEHYVKPLVEKADNGEVELDFTEDGDLAVAFPYWMSDSAFGEFFKSTEDQVAEFNRGECGLWKVKDVLKVNEVKVLDVPFKDLVEAAKAVSAWDGCSKTSEWCK